MEVDKKVERILKTVVEMQQLEESKKYRNVCEKCEKPKSDDTPLLKCGKCTYVFYCGRECQIADWPEHKSVCGKFINDDTKAYLIMNCVKDGTRQFAKAVEDLHYPVLDPYKSRLFDIAYKQWPPIQAAPMYAVMSFPIEDFAKICKVAKETGMIIKERTVPTLSTGGSFPIVIGPNVHMLENGPMKRSQKAANKRR